MIEHLNHGQLTLPIAFAISMTGSALGLLLARHARRQETRWRRVPWLIGAAFAIGGTGVWVMHFVAMLDFAVRGAVILYDPWTTLLSALIAVAVVACGLFVIGLGRYTRGKLAGAGIVTGLGIAAMHYMGMAAIRSDIQLSHRTEYVLAAVVIAIVAATAALWLAWRLQRAVAMWLGAIVMALAVNLMHYTAMFGLEVGDRVSGPLNGTSAMSLVIPMGTLTAIVLIILVFMVVIIPTEKELLAEQTRITSMAQRADHTPAPPPQRRRPSPYRTGVHR
ncbi:MHYT domain-containing protein [Stackebrandtia endophytica]|nr:MHYT domain-containing protein [Stackebrandtia endophytica]